MTESPWNRNWAAEQDARDMARFKRKAKTLLAVLTVATITGVMAHSCVDATVRTAEIQEQYYSKPVNGEHEGYRVFFAKHGSDHAEEMAKGIMSVKPGNRPTLAAVAVAESNGNPNLAGTGWRKLHHGAFQVNPRIHGRVPKDAAGQALQAERILEDLVAESPRGGLRHGLIRYNGGKSPAGRVVAGRYADKVIRLAKEVR